MHNNKSDRKYVKITEGKVSKGGVNAKPSTPRPNVTITGQGTTRQTSQTDKTQNKK
ncbi:MAG TPA: hypothetical protein PKC29_04555 [Thermodesulfobacteriota bacterium]|nr:hypothetical protein [Thermodesulfobacteriota bacterium]